MATLIAAAGCIEFPREIDADAASVAICFRIYAIADAVIFCSFEIIGAEDVSCQQGHAEAFVFQELPAEAEVQATAGLLNNEPTPIIRINLALYIQQPCSGEGECVVETEFRTEALETMGDA